ncbi:hypothetical protein [Mucilaginibacter sp. PPCGB 2223]|uniref:hypothetical protein n=1 Tax=Mucilaginibacter sp. PPCGB 2223 TaxID=1886027 RepID=UPI001111EFCB|nr:hypothetical protein [Mucilaginibacter sp. PPCGB 2223]
MKNLVKYSLIIAFAGLLFSSCSTTQKAVSYTAGASRSKFVGTWMCNTVTYQDIVTGTVQKVFDQAPPQAFVNSTWILTNSGNGQYSLVNGMSQSIYWSYYNPGNGEDPAFQFKKVYQGDKAKDIDSGYRLVIGSIDGNTMVLKTPVKVGSSKIGYVIYTFTKTK